MPLHRNRGRDTQRSMFEKAYQRSAEYRRSHLSALLIRAQGLHHVPRRRPVRPREGICEALAVELRMTLPAPPGGSVQQPVQLGAHRIREKRKVDLVRVLVLDDAPGEAT